MSKNFFENYPKTTLLGIIAITCLIVIVVMEILAAQLFGLGKTILYRSHPIYGYRPAPHQTVARQPGVVIHINNLGFRAAQDWDLAQTANKVLFLGDSVTYGGSYITNEDLFSNLAVLPFPEFVAGNAGVNAWGVDNVCAFIKDMEFLPAQIYISVFPEGDFYRGLMRIGGQPFWTKQPRFALEELFQYLVYTIHNKKITSTLFTDDEKTKIAKMSVSHLKELDNYLKAQGKQHLIYISPSRSQLLHSAQIDETLHTLFKKYDLKVTYLKDKLNNLPKNKINRLFHDEIHLSIEGHYQWAQCIAPDLQPLTKGAYENQNTKS